ncbi:PREDICTED: uncharacterized protein LOC106809514 [Priapulus caudatus]|uniref:Uncharacterized protein LOC106809514 n=1 Tax=Priapulus caudatus TaxID=37621 RepID=A0ABM1E7C3_PRICU|nr:PREDICTED: uncharacterized protein LOC106809514 [Priapulus caudatus]
MLQRGLRILPRRTSVATTTQHKLQGSDASRRVSSVEAAPDSVEATPASTETTPTLINTSRSLTGVTADSLPASTPRRRRHPATKPRLDSEVPATTTAPPSGKASSRSAARKKRATARANNRRTSEPDAVSAMMADAVAPASEGKPEVVTAATKGSEVEGVTAATKGSEVEGVTAATKGRKRWRYKHGNLVHKTSIKTVHAKTSGEATKPPKRGGRQPKQTVAPPAGEDRLSPTVRVEDVPASPPSAVTLADGTTIKTESDSSVGIPYAIPAVHALWPIVCPVARCLHVHLFFIVSGAPSATARTL